MAPDFEYFVRMKSSYSHTFDGIFWFDLPVGFLLLVLFYCLIRKSFIDSLPNIFRCRFANVRNLNWWYYFAKEYPAIILSIIIGAITHLLWDSFTHARGVFVLYIPLFRTMILPYLPVYRLLQHISTFIGAIVIIIYVKGLPKSAVPKTYTNKFAYWLISIALTIIIFLVMRFVVWEKYIGLWHTVVALIPAFILSITIAGTAKLVFDVYRSNFF
jgi:hypothetical protein